MNIFQHYRAKRHLKRAIKSIDKELVWYYEAAVSGGNQAVYREMHDLIVHRNKLIDRLNDIKKHGYRFLWWSV